MYVTKSLAVAVQMRPNAVSFINGPLLLMRLKLISPQFVEGDAAFALVVQVKLEGPSVARVSSWLTALAKRFVLLRS